MKTYKNLWEQLVTDENIWLAYNNAKKHKNNQRQVKEFQKNLRQNLIDIQWELVDLTYKVGEYRTKKIYEPKERDIFILPFRDRIVQHAIMNVLKPVLTNLLMENCYACIDGRGQMRAMHKCNEYVRKNKYCLKCDIRKFYPSINQRILSNMLHEKIADEKFMRILDSIIFSFKGGWNCPIGNYCSQWFGNFYLSKLDNYILHTLHLGDTERFCDDFNIFSNDKKILQDAKVKIEYFIKKELDLEYSKAEIFNTKQGVDFCGYRCFGSYVLVRKKTAQRMIKKFKKGGLSNNQIQSMYGWIKHSCSHNLKVKLEELAKNCN